MARELITYSNFYKDSKKILKSLTEPGMNSKSGNLLFGQQLVCGDFAGLASSIIGAKIIVNKNAIYGHGAKITDFREPSLDTGSKWTCLVFLTESEEDMCVDFWQHKRTGIKRVCQTEYEATEEDIIDGYSGGNKLQDALIKDLKDKDKWKKQCSVNIENNTALFFRSDIPHTVPENFFNSGIVQVFYFGDDNAD